MPEHRSRTLLNAPATITRNLVQPELDRPLTLEILTRPTALKEPASNHSESNRSVRGKCAASTA